MKEAKKKTEKTTQPECLDENGHLILQPIIDIAKEYDCPFIGLIGEKRIGKTYGCISYCLQQYYKHGYKAFYSRRYDKTFTENICGDLVNAHRQDIINLSKGKHNVGYLRGKYFDLARAVTTNSGTTVRKNPEHFMYCRSLNNIETETADDKGDISAIIYDEFLTRGVELRDEFNKLMILHANATGKRTDKFTPMFLLGNTVSKESAVAECFGINMREIKRGVNIITNTKGEARIILYYVPPTKKGAASAATYYDRFENEHINMISRGDWTLGTYRIASEYEKSLQGFSMLVTHKDIAVKLTVTSYGMNPRIVITKPDNIYQLRCCTNLSKEAIMFIPANIIKMILQGYMVVESPEIGENFRDICKHLKGCEQVLKVYE